MPKTARLVVGFLFLLPAISTPAADPPAAEKPAEKPVERDLIVAPVDGGYEITFDVTETPELKEWVNAKLKPACVTWYPKIVAMLPSEGYEPPKKMTVVFLRNGRGVAATGGTRITCAYNWFKDNLDGEAAGAVVHELVHVVQQYGRARRAEGGGERPNRNPGWLVEGVADWIRWFNYEPENLRPHPNPEKAKHTDSYRTTAHFLDYVVRKYDKDVIPKLNAAMRTGKYDEGMWNDLTGKTLEELGKEWKESLK